MYYKKMCRSYNGHFKHYYPFETVEKQVRYSKAREAVLFAAIIRPLSLLIDESKIFVR